MLAPTSYYSPIIHLHYLVILLQIICLASLNWLLLSLPFGQLNTLFTDLIVKGGDYVEQPLKKLLQWNTVLPWYHWILVKAAVVTLQGYGQSLGIFSTCCTKLSSFFFLVFFLKYLSYIKQGGGYCVCPRIVFRVSVILLYCSLFLIFFPCKSPLLTNTKKYFSKLFYKALNKTA